MPAVVTNFFFGLGLVLVVVLGACSLLFLMMLATGVDPSILWLSVGDCVQDNSNERWEQPSRPVKILEFGKFETRTSGGNIRNRSIEFLYKKVPCP